MSKLTIEIERSSKTVAISELEYGEFFRFEGGGFGIRAGHPTEDCGWLDLSSGQLFSCSFDRKVTRRRATLTIHPEGA